MASCPRVMAVVATDTELGRTLWLSELLGVIARWLLVLGDASRHPGLQAPSVGVPGGGPVLRWREIGREGAG